MPKAYFSLSVHQLVDFLLREGDIDDRVYNLSTMQEGTRIHGEYQNSQEEGYIAELPLSETFERELGTIVLSGKADGLYVDKDGNPVIEEIKSTVSDLGEFSRTQSAWHFGQAECYALMYLHSHKEANRATIRLVYISQKKGRGKKTVRQSYSLASLERKVYGYLDDYLGYFHYRSGFVEDRNRSELSLAFPFPDFRKGQKELAAESYLDARHGSLSLVEAPTGIGKTVSTLFGALKAMGEGHYGKLFYFTAKGTGEEAARKAYKLLRDKGLKARYSSLLGKEKMCLNPGSRCNPDECPFARGYYGKLREAMAELGPDEDAFFGAEKVRQYASGHLMCPFELSLDLSEQADIVVADYNYLIDPLAKLERYFEVPDQKGDFALVDEAHNLVERGREAFSAEIDAFVLGKALRKLKEAGFDKARRALDKVAAKLGEIDRESPDDSEMLKAIAAYEEKRREEEKNRAEGEEGAPFPKEAAEASRLLHRYLVIAGEYGLNSKLIATPGRDGRTVKANRLSLDPSHYLMQALGPLKGATLFSGTLSPLGYYRQAIFGDGGPTMALPSPFDKSHMGLFLAPLGLRYREREETFSSVMEMIRTFVKGKKGNYLVFFPSFEYLEKAAEELRDIEGEVLVQTRDMGEEERKRFISRFAPDPKKTLVGLSVLGGSFSEGVDLMSDRLIGVVIVGLGLPGVCQEREAIRRYYEEKEGGGYYYAYLAPGLNKVLQGVGRLIRSESDVGAALLIDSRYLGSNRELLESHYGKAEVVFSPAELSRGLAAFYGKQGL